MAKGNNTLLIFDFDNTITNRHMHNAFSGKYSGIEKSDYNSAAENAVTDTNIKDFLENTGGIKNEERLKSTLQSAFSNVVEVNIASFTGYPNAVKRVAENHLGLSKEQADSVSVYGELPENYDNELTGDKEQQSKVGKNLHICKAIVEYKNKHGQLPKTVMLVDDDVKNIQKINKFVESMSKRGGWLKENGLSVEDIQKIKFEGVQVPKEDKNVGYLERVQEFVNANLVQEPIYENLKKEKPIYQNLQDIQRSLSETVPKEPIYQNNENRPPLPPKKRKLSAVPTHNDIVVSGKDEKQVYTKTIPLVQEFRAIKVFFQDYAQKIIDAICNLFKNEVITKIKKQGYSVSSKESEITVKGSKSIDTSKINKDIIVKSLAQIIENKEKIKDLENNYKGDQLEREIPKLLNADLQKKDINSNSVRRNYNDGEPTHQTVQEARNYPPQKKDINSNSVRGNYNDGEPIFQTCKEASNYPPQKKDINSNSVRGNYNGGEPTHQTVQEARNYPPQKKGIDSNPVSKKPLAPPVPPKNHTEKVTQNRNNNIIERGGQRFV